MTQYTLKQASQLLQSKQISAVELATEYLAAIAAQNPAINGYITLDQDKTLEEARAADARIAQGTATALTGVPIAYKDIFCQTGWRSACSSKMLDNFVSPYTATVVQNLLDEGMVTLGRTNMDEFAMGSTNETSFYGATKNPWNPEHVPGGSSGGSAAVVAARLAPVALGSDTGGSIRQPASHCGITGIKPTYGTVSRFGMVAYASSFDQAGPMAQTAEDCAILLNAMASFDERDSTSLERSKEDYTLDLDKPLKGMKIGLPKEYFGEGIDEKVKEQILAAAKHLEKLGAIVEEVSLPHSKYGVAVYYIIASSEASSNLQRFDGIRYGYRAQDIKNLEDLYVKSRSEGFGPEVKRRIMLGTFSLSAGSYDKHFKKAGQVRTLIINDFAKVFEKYDLILGPTTPTPAWDLGARVDDPLSMYLADLLTIPVNLAGLPGISIPAGFADGLPVGMQLIGKRYDEETIYQVAAAFEATTDFHKKQPIIFGK